MTRLGGTLAAAGLAVLVGGLAWALYATGAFNFNAGSPAIVAMIIAGVIGTGGLAGAFMWLAFYSARKGYDEGPIYRGPGEQPQTFRAADGTRATRMKILEPDGS